MPWAKLKLFTLWLVALNGVLIVSLLVVSTKILTNSVMKTDNCSVSVKNDSMKSDYRRYCFKSSEEECLERGYHLKQEDNQTVCCGNSNEHLYNILSEEISHRLRVDTRREMMLNRVKGYITQLHHDPLVVKERPVAHVGILQNGNLTGPDTEVPRIHWEKSGERSFVSEGVIHGGDRLTVTKSGYYFVYTGLQFTVDPHTVDTGAIVAYLYRHVNGSKESRQKLMMSRESSCRMTRKDVTGPVSMYMAGIYLLRKGEEISVRTARQSYLHRSSAASYLGIHIV